ncbi:MAG: phenylalanine--tRNA ligase subunit alpha [Candidatus Omnitrophica bacterium]|nr:phenylalanine--tRNA ligase subunit alpha [Candidatus Omnitrophota bacterium]
MLTLEQIDSIDKEFEDHLAKVNTAQSLETLRVHFLGKKGKVTFLLKELGALPPGERAEFGRRIHELKNHAESQIQAYASKLKPAGAKNSDMDLTLPGLRPPAGHLHPITQTIRKILSIFSKMGFQAVDGREIETEFYNFTALNIPLDHPSRDAFDTFYTRHGNLLRSQTSTVQIRIMERHKPPLKIIAPGKVYRPDTVDASHSFMFHQIEGLQVDEKSTFSDLKGTLAFFLRELFGSSTKVRFRPHFFPFTEPSVEVDMSCFMCHGKGCPVCARSGWIEVLGAGSVHPNVLEAAGISGKKYQGFAFGLGVERMTMLRYGIHDIRLFFENDLRFLRQF